MTSILERVQCFQHALFLTICLAIVGVTGGCGESDPLGRRAISGSVTLDGAPIEKGSIGFQPADKSITSGGDAITNGKYSIPRESGLPVGKYRVTINAPKPGTGGDVAAGALPGEAVPVPQEMIPPEWNAKSEQFIEVTEKGPYVFNFDVKSKGK